MSGTHLTPDELAAQIETQREHLAETVDQLAHKLDVKAQATARMRRIRPQHVAAFVAAALVVGSLVWWRRRR
jgi:hypothetical protein